MGPTRGASHGPVGQERERGAHAERHRDMEHRRPEREAARGYSPAARGSPGGGTQKSQSRPNKRRHKNCDHVRDRTQCARRGSSSFTGRPDTVEGPIASQGRRGRRRWSRGGRPREEHQQEHTGGGASDPGASAPRKPCRDETRCGRTGTPTGVAALHRCRQLCQAVSRNRCEERV